MSQYQPFQFLLVRLKGYMGISLGGGGCISIPTGTIKSLIDFSTPLIYQYFNSYWYD